MRYTAIFHGCKNGTFQMKTYDIFNICAQNIYRGYMLERSNEYPLSMFKSKNKKKRIPLYTPVKALMGSHVILINFMFFEGLTWMYVTNRLFLHDSRGKSKEC